jgi:hypothetical protein
VSEKRRRFALNDDIWIERLDEQLAKNVQKACDPPNYNIDFAGYDRHLYAFVCRAHDAKANYVGISALHAVIALSRLVNPTSTGDRYCAKILHFGLEGSAIQAMRWYGMSPDVSLATNHRDWLSVQDGETLCTLTPWLSKEMHRRVHRAYWNYEYAMRSYYLDARWTLVVSGLEALINVGDRDCAGQFRNRVKQLADESQIGLSTDDLTIAYKLRSKLVHAEGFLSQLQTILRESEHSALYGKLESVLRETVLRCFLDEKFGDFFRDDDAVKARFP